LTASDPAPPYTYPLSLHDALPIFQVFALNVLNQGHFQHLLVVGLADVGRNGLQAGQLGRLQAALPRNELVGVGAELAQRHRLDEDRKSTRLNSSHVSISYAVFCLK